MAGDRKVIAGLEDVLAHARGDPSRAHLSTVQVPREVNVRAVRQGLGMSQEEFALCFGFSLGTLRNWEQGIRRPDGPARVLLTLIERIPDEVREALAA